MAFEASRVMGPQGVWMATMTALVAASGRAGAVSLVASIRHSKTWTPCSCVFFFGVNTP